MWVIVEHPAGWGDAPLVRSEHGVRILLARGPHPQPGLEPAGHRVWVAHCGTDPVLRTGTVADPRDVAAWDLAAIASGSHLAWGAPDPGPLLLVCANGRRDRCCGHSGGRLADRLWSGPQARRVLTCTHLGGHRFAPTALLLPTGALHGRLDDAYATGLLEAAAAGWMPADRLRGFSSLPEPAQVADAHARQMLGLTAPRPLPVDLLAGTDGDRLNAVVTLPAAEGTSSDSDRAAQTLEVPLERACTEIVPSCGVAATTSRRWRAAAAGPRP